MRLARIPKIISGVVQAYGSRLPNLMLKKMEILREQQRPHLLESSGMQVSRTTPEASRKDARLFPTSHFHNTSRQSGQSTIRGNTVPLQDLFPSDDRRKPTFQPCNSVAVAGWTADPQKTAPCFNIPVVADAKRSRDERPHCVTVLQWEAGRTSSNAGRSQVAMKQVWRLAGLPLLPSHLPFHLTAVLCVAKL